MDKHYEDRQFAHAFGHAQMMQNQLKRKRTGLVANLEQTSREIEFDKKLFAAQEKIRKERAMAEQVAEESAESFRAVFNVILQGLGLAFAASVLYWVFIAFSGI